MAEVPISGFLPPQPQQSLDQYLEIWEERWNKRVDQDVSILGEGLGRVLAEAQRGMQPSLSATATSHLSLQLQTQTLIQSAESLLALTHQLKLLVLLSDEQVPKDAIAKEQRELSEDVGKVKLEIGNALTTLAESV